MFSEECKEGGVNMTYYDRLRNSYDRQYYQTLEDREYEIEKMSERQELLREKALYDSERRRGK